MGTSLIDIQRNGTQRLVFQYVFVIPFCLADIPVVILDTVRYTGGKEVSTYVTIHEILVNLFCATLVESASGGRKQQEVD